MKAPRRCADMISDLPGHIIETILIRLSLQDAVRTSILSKNWRYKWATIPQLIFDERLLEESAGNQLFSRSKLFSVLLQVLLLHEGPILKFSLAISTSECSYSEIDQSIRFLSRNDVEEFSFYISGPLYKLPSSFFLFSRLTRLDLEFCVFKPPPKFKGFHTLTILNFIEVDITAEVLEEFISNCPLLESFTISSSKVVRYKIFHRYKGTLSRLKWLYLGYSFKEVVQEHMEGRNSYFFELFIFLSANVEDLGMDSNFFLDLGVGPVPKSLPTPLVYLKVLRLYDLCFEEPDEISFAICLIRSSPNLKIIDFQMNPSADGVGVLPQLPGCSDISLNHLVEVRINQFSGVRAELEFVKFLLAKSPVLVKMSLKPNLQKVTDNGLWILNHIVVFPRASPLAEVTFGNPPSTS